MIRIWPWTTFAKMDARIKWHESREKDWLFRVELYKNLALQSRRDLAAAHKGIRRLHARLKKLEQAQRTT